jgi:S-(hydroxymethyl)glutathione dehydrogenase/alcohol dehydrogenase
LDRAAMLGCGVITGFGAVVNRARVRPFNSVVVVGTGGVGINSLQGASYSGAYPVIAVDTLDAKLETAKKFGATHTVNAGQSDAVETVKKLTGGRGADFVFITVASLAAIKQGFAMTGPRGMTVIVGVPSGKDNLVLTAGDFMRMERTLTGCFMGSVNLKLDIPRLVELYRMGKLKLDEMITARYPLDRINEAIESTEKGQAVRNVIVF